MYQFSNQTEGKETVFTIKSQDVKFGVGALRELWSDARSLGMNQIALFLDSNIKASKPISLILESFQSSGLEVDIYDDVVCEPNTSSCMAAADFVKQGEYDGIVSIGGGSVMDTAKAANLLSCHGGEILDYVNAPIGLAKRSQVPYCLTLNARPHQGQGLKPLASWYLILKRWVLNPESPLHI